MSETNSVMIVDPVLPGYASCGCYVGPWLGTIPPPMCPMHAGGQWVPQTYPTTTTTTLKWPPEPGLSDADIERIAERVAEKLRPKRKRKP